MFRIFYLKVTNNMVNQNMKWKGVIPDIVIQLGCIEKYNSYNRNIKENPKYLHIFVFSKRTGGQIA